MSLIQGLPKSKLYCIISPSITCNHVCTILDPTIIGNEIDPIIDHKASLKALNCKEGAHICEKGRFKFL